MSKKKLREGLKNLEAYMEQYEVELTFLEEGEEAPMDTLVLGLEVSDELSFDVSCNFVDTDDYGSILQFYAQMTLDGLMEENPGMLTELKLLQTVNTLNQMLPVGQIVYIQGEQTPQHSLGLRYTMRTELSGEEQLEKCADVIELLMDDYELLCSMLIQVADGEGVQEAMELVMRLMEEE